MTSHNVTLMLAKRWKPTPTKKVPLCPYWSHANTIAWSSNLAVCNATPHTEWLEIVSIGLEELGIKLHPMETQGVQETFENIHAQEHSKRDREPHTEHDVDGKAIPRSGNNQCHSNRFGVEHLRKLLMRQRQRPDTEIRCCMRHSSKNILNGLDDLMDDSFAHVELAMAVAVATAASINMI